MQGAAAVARERKTGSLFLKAQAERTDLDGLRLPVLPPQLSPDSVQDEQQGRTEPTGAHRANDTKALSQRQWAEALVGLQGAGTQPSPGAARAASAACHLVHPGASVPTHSRPPGSHRLPAFPSPLLNMLRPLSALLRLVRSVLVPLPTP